MDAVGRLSHVDVASHTLPDSGTLRTDLVAMILPKDEAEQQYRVQVLARVATLALTEDPRLAAAAKAVSLGPWVHAIEVLLSDRSTAGSTSTST